MQHDTPPKFANPVLNWIEYRLPVFSLLDNSLGSNYPTPRNLNYWWNFGSIAGLCLLLQILTGLFLAMHYAPNVALAFDSVERIMRDVNYGWLIRYMHAVGASMFFLVVYIHTFRGLYYGSYKTPRELLWWLGLVILLLMMATAFMGYVLPWGQMSFWGATVITNFFSALPGVGEDIVLWLRGGFAVENATLSRFYALHFLLPFVIVGVVVLHIWALHQHGSNNPLGIDVQSPQDSIGFHPYYTVKDLFGFGVFALFFAWFVFYAPNALGHPDNYIPANAMVTPPHIVPEWYFLPFYAILRSVPDVLVPFTDIVVINSKLLGVIAMFASIVILFFLPWIDRSSVRSATFRPLYRLLFWVFLVNALVLGYAGSQTPDWAQLVVFCAGDACEGVHPWLLKISSGALAPYLPDISIPRIATFWYFFHFALLWSISKNERTLPLPRSIGASVLAGGH